jgi:hypothetical protein
MLSVIYAECRGAVFIYNKVYSEKCYKTILGVFYTSEQ